MKPVTSSPTHTLESLIKGWNFNPKHIEGILKHFNYSYDQTDEYLDMMDSEGVDHPKDCWEFFCDVNRIEHEIDNNPFTNI